MIFCEQNPLFVLSISLCCASDLLERGFRAKSGFIGTDVVMSLVGNLENGVRSVKIIWG